MIDVSKHSEYDNISLYVTFIKGGYLLPNLLSIIKVISIESSPQY